ncbi:hypothetical protein FQR65_LT19365 [Abscondita terminalis]|nr:hypothetical protein FQR65_LT19365 [Abscondita terminalis]
MTSKEKIAALRSAMHNNNIDAFIVYSADPHMSEYLPQEWQERSWLSGFTGSAGFVVITKDKAGLWTDGRYFTQAPIELEGSGIDLFKDGIEGTPNYIDWIISEIPAGGKVAVNALATSHSNLGSLDANSALKIFSLTDLPLLKKKIGQIVYCQPKNPIYVHRIEEPESVSDNNEDYPPEKMEISACQDVHIISSVTVAWTLEPIEEVTYTNPAGKEPMNEYSIGEKLRGFRAEGANFVGESFSSIIGYKGNGAIIHYSAKAEGSKEVTQWTSILVDSGGRSDGNN